MKRRLLLLLGAIATAVGTTLLERKPLGDSSFALHAAMQRIKAVWQTPSPPLSPHASNKTETSAPAVPTQPAAAGTASQTPLPGDCTKPQANTDLRHCNFSNGLPHDADFSGADLRGVSIGGRGEQGELNNISFLNANLEGATFVNIRSARNSVFQGTNFTGVKGISPHVQHFLSRDFTLIGEPGKPELVEVAQKPVTMQPQDDWLAKSRIGLLQFDGAIPLRQSAGYLLFLNEPKHHEHEDETRFALLRVGNEPPFTPGCLARARLGAQGEYGRIQKILATERPDGSVAFAVNAAGGDGGWYWTSVTFGHISKNCALRIAPALVRHADQLLNCPSAGRRVVVSLRDDNNFRVERSEETCVNQRPVKAMLTDHVSSLQPFSDLLRQLDGLRDHSPAFQCAKAKTLVEIKICESSALSKLDQEIALAFSDSLTRESDAQAAVSAQGQWLRQTRDICQNEPCLHAAMTARLAALGGKR